MKKSYDFSNGVRGKYASRCAKAANIVVLDSDVQAQFPNSKIVNETLRSLGKIVSLQRGAVGGAAKARRSSALRRA